MMPSDETSRIAQRWFRHRLSPVREEVSAGGITFNTYPHVLSNMQDSAIEAMEAASGTTGR
jgi:hypothetical protein